MRLARTLLLILLPLWPATAPAAEPARAGAPGWLAWDQGKTA